MARMLMVLAGLIIALNVKLSFAAAIIKCIKNGHITYTDLNCPNEALAEPFSNKPLPPNDPLAAHRRYLANKKKLLRIQSEKKRAEQEQKRAARIARLQEEHLAAQEYRCKRLDRQRQAARIESGPKRHYRPQMELRQLELARLRIEQSEDNYKQYCLSDPKR